MRHIGLFLALCLCLCLCAKLERDNLFDPASITYMPVPAVGEIGFDAKCSFVHLHWGNVEGAIRYGVSRYVNSTDSPEFNMPTVEPFFDDSNEVQEGAVYRYRVVAVFEDGRESEPSEAKVDVPMVPICLHYPRGGEEFLVGKPVIIRWRVVAQDIQAVIVKLSTNGGGEFTTLTADFLDRATESHLWTPKPADVGNTCIIRVQPPTDPDRGMGSQPFRVVPN